MLLNDIAQTVVQVITTTEQKKVKGGTADGIIITDINLT